MKRKERILYAVRQLSGPEDYPKGVTAQELSEHLGLDRGNVSRELNQLVLEGSLSKSATRPVRFFPQSPAGSPLLPASDAEEDCFNSLVGADMSIRGQILQAKSAMLYPPHGLHTILTGPTGTGKTTFAQRMHQYAIQIGTLEAGAPFIEFNCAEYAQNPQLLNATLFGYKKGAYTGADKDMPGMVESAAGGILFLDEIHRLPYEGQEMLFTLMDIGKYRRLGETQLNRSANVLIIGATTEDLSATLLKTFLRRVPVTIQIPALSNRSLLERLQFIEMFISEEQKNIGIPIRVSNEVLLSLLFYNCAGNIGQMKVDIQLLCAWAYLECKNKRRHLVELTRDMLPDHISQGFQRGVESNQRLALYLRYQHSSFTFTDGPTPDGPEGICWPDTTISRRYISLKQYEASHSELTPDQTAYDISMYIRGLTVDYEEANLALNRDAILKFVDARVYDCVMTAISFAEFKLDTVYSDRTKIGLLMHVKAILENPGQSAHLDLLQISRIERCHPEEFQIAKIMIKIIEEELSVRFGRHEACMVAMFLVSEAKARTTRIGIVLMAHGESTARSMADAVNYITGEAWCQAIDMPLSSSYASVYTQAVELVTQIDDGKGVLLLTDMGSLNTFAERIQDQTGIPVRYVPMVSTPIAIHAVQLTTDENCTLDDLASHLCEDFAVAFSDRQAPPPLSQELKRLILVTCVSGRGAALKIGEIVRDVIGPREENGIDLKYVDINGTSEDGCGLSETEKREVIATVGTTKLQMVEAPFISIDELVIGDGGNRLRYILEGRHNALTVGAEDSPSSSNRSVVTMAIKSILSFLDAERVSSPILDCYHHCLEQLHIPDSQELAIRFCVHMAGMIERLILRKPLPYKGLSALREQYAEAFSLIKKETACLDALYGIELPDSEIAYLVEILYSTP